MARIAEFLHLCGGMRRVGAAGPNEIAVGVAIPCCISLNAFPDHSAGRPEECVNLKHGYLTSGCAGSTLSNADIRHCPDLALISRNRLNRRGLDGLNRNRWNRPGWTACHRNILSRHGLGACNKESHFLLATGTCFRRANLVVLYDVSIVGRDLPALRYFGDE